ncbi:helix-turn-helix domain-containing protein [Metabacillus endolithicus]|uniref:Helix-turn-helix domain-containing protein n=1 Tax=Metabacillus endolithicus TaxID=1535204 RepID=A0ABW5C598_9BACI
MVQKNMIDVAKEIFKSHVSIVEAWENKWKILSDNPYEDGIVDTASFRAYLLILEEITNESNLPISNLKSWIYNYRDRIVSFVEPFIENEWSYNRTRKNTRDIKSENQELVTSLVNTEFAESGSALIFHKLRETISKNEFKDIQVYPTAQISDERKKMKAVAQVRNEANKGLRLTSSEIEQWQNLTDHAISVMDDLTADIFDIISIMWMKKAQYKDEMIHFHCDDALNLRNIQGRSGGQGEYQTGYRKKDRDDVMKRLAALSSIWIRIEKDELRLVDEETKNIDRLEQVQFNPLFLVDSITVAYRGDEPVGIYECSIRPGEIMSHFLFGARKESGFLALKALQYNPIRQKYHKRLARYLAWQWRIRQKKADYFRPYNLSGDKGILKVMGLEINERYPQRTKETVENVLDTLLEDKIIDNWEYVGDFDGISSKKFWLEGWLNSQVRIIPTKDLLSQYKKENIEEKQTINTISMLQSLIEKEMKIVSEYENSTNDDTNALASLFTKERKKRNLSISAAASQIGVSHSTLSRFERGQIKKPTNENIEKIKNWLGIEDLD